MDPIWLKEVKCKACDNIFKTPRVRTGQLKVKEMESDFHKIYEGINPIYYAITTCPECNYSARNEDFDKMDLEYHPEVIKLALAIKNSHKNIKFEEKTTIDLDEAVKKHLLAITFYKRFKPENPNTIAGLYMHIVWMYRENKNYEKEKEYLKYALEYYIKTFERGTFIPEKLGEPGIMYLIGELNRRLGNYEEAIKWFARVIHHDLIENYPNIENLTRDAWEKITEEKRKNK